MNGGVGGVCELGGNERPRSFFGDLMCFRYGSLHAVCARCQHNRGAIGLRELATFDGHGFRHGEDHAVSACGGEGGKRDAGVAAGGLDDGCSWSDQAFFFGIVEHGDGDTVFYRPDGVEVFRLRKDAALGAECVRDVEKRGVS